MTSTETDPMTKACCVLLITLITHTVQAQLPFQLSGKVTDTTGMALSYATINLIADQDTLSTLSGEDGSFSMSNLKARKFTLRITMKGYFSYSQLFNLLAEKQSFILPSVSLRVDYSGLDPVTVTRLRPITIQGDTLTYNAFSFPVRNGSEVEDLLKRLPGVEVDMDGNVIVQGKPITKVLVNGKEFFGGDVLLAIRNLPADVVSKIQVIDDYGDQARLTGIRSGESVKVLNIVLSQDKSNGKFGSIQAGAGDYGKYSTNIFGNAFNGDRQISAIGSLSNNSPTGSDVSESGALNYADQWSPLWSGSFNANITSQSPNSYAKSIQYNYYSGEQLEQTQNAQSASENKNETLNGTITYRPDKYSTLRINPSFSLQQLDNPSLINSTSLQQDSGFTKSTSGYAIDKSKTIGQSINTSAYYERLFPHSRRRFSAQLAFSYSGNQQTSNNLSQATVITDSITNFSILHYLVTNNTNNQSLSFNTVYFTPLNSHSFLELGYRGKSDNALTNLLTQQSGNTGSVPITIDSLSQQPTYQALVQNIHVGYRANFNKVDLSAGLDGQPGSIQGSTDTKGDITSYHYFSFLPVVQGSWKINKGKKINWNYTGQPGLPGLQQVAAYTNLTNPQFPITGNPLLKPSYIQLINFHYEQSSLHPTQYQGFLVGLSYSNTGNSIIQSITHPKDTSQVIQQTTYVNAGTTRTITANYRLNFPSFFNKHLRIVAFGTFSKNHTPTMTDGLIYDNQNWTWIQSMHLQLIVPDRIETEVEGNYSISCAVYPGSDNLPNTFKTASIALAGKIFIIQHWVFNFRLSQPYTSSGKELQQAPTYITATLQKQFLPHNQATINITGYNLLNNLAGVGQSSSPTTIVQTRTQMIGRYFLCTFILKFNRFKR